jgi:drug/metabolite transporter superfamily protein YnfA
MAPFVIAALAALLSTFAFRRWATVESGFWTLFICLVITVLSTFLTLVTIPAGRAALKDLKLSAYLLLGPVRFSSTGVDQ